MGITVKATSVLGDSVLIETVPASLYPGGRYVKQADWGKDSEAVTAEIADYLAKQAAPVMPTASDGKTVTMNDAEIAAKLAAIQAAKDAAAEADPA